MSTSAPPEMALDDVAVPAAVAAVAAGSPLRVVWRNVLGGLTFAIEPENPEEDRSFVKFAPAGSGLRLHLEAERLRWAAGYTPVPRVLGEGADETGVWLHTAALPGRSAVDARWRAAPETAVRAIAAGLRALHERVPPADCPFDWGVNARLANSRREPAVPHEAWQRVQRPPPIDRLVVCHGDACAPNTLIGDDGGWAGHVDMAALGVADRWADLAVGSWSLSWNYGTTWESLFFSAYGIEPDPDRIAYYRLLWDLEA